jgi:glycosyltransferase involved in cell wall biosynthesis
MMNYKIHVSLFMQISVIIPAHNEEKYIGPCIESALEHAPADFLQEIVVVDNASTDRTAEVAARYPKVRVLHEAEKGVTHARQRGLSTVRSDLIAFVDADTRLPAHWFPSVHREFSTQPELVSLSGPYVYYDLSEKDNVWVKRYWRYLAHSSYKISRAMVVGGNFVARRGALEKIGGFDTSIVFYGDDTNIARRLKEEGTVKFCPDFFVYSSGRRLQEEGLLKTSFTYGLNYLSEMVLHRPATKRYKDYR